MAMLYSQRLKSNVVVDSIHFTNDFASGVIPINNERVGFI